jgi:hypothetical protein
MTEKKNAWKLLGHFDAKGRVSLAAAAVAVIFASETFIVRSGHYPIYMSVFALVAGGYAVYQAVKVKAMFGILVGLLALLWLNPLFGGNWFDAMNATFFLSHAIFAMCYGIAAYTYLRGVANGNR